MTTTEATLNYVEELGQDPERVLILESVRTPLYLFEGEWLLLSEIVRRRKEAQSSSLRTRP